MPAPKTPKREMMQAVAGACDEEGHVDHYAAQSFQAVLEQWWRVS